MVEGVPPSSKKSFIFSKDMTHDQVIETAKKLGADEKTIKSLEGAMANDTDKIVSNNVEAEMLHSIFDPKYKMKSVTKDNGIVNAHNNDESFNEYTLIDEDTDVSHSSSWWQLNDRCATNESYYFDHENNVSYFLRDNDGDGRPDNYKEIKGFSERLRYIALKLFNK